MRLREIRENNNLSQKDLALSLKVSRSTYSIWELEQSIIPLERLNTFCNKFNISLDYALGLTNIKNYENSNPEINKNICANRIKQIRKENKYTQAKIASILNTDNGVISRYEHGETLILTSFLYEYALIFNISCDYLTGKINNPIKIKTTPLKT